MHNNLIIFSGLPGTGKTTIAKQLAKVLENSVYIRIDSIETAIKNSLLNVKEVIDAGYLAAYNLAKENLELGKIVIADSVNSIEITRNAWREVATKLNKEFLEIEIICSDKIEHKQRIENRISDLKGQKLPSWQDVLNRDYQKWQKNILTIDTSILTIEESTDIILKNIKK